MSQTTERAATAEPHPGYPAYDRQKRIPVGSWQRNLLLKITRAVMRHTPFRRYMHYRYPYLFSPQELAFLVQCVTDTRDVQGDIFEIGCAAGHTTCFLQRHLRTSGIKKNYYCIDTFSGFTSDDVAFEINQRDKPNSPDFHACDVNDLDWFKLTLKLNHCEDVICVQTDVKKYRFETPVSFCLLDVDLYQPTLYALENIWPVLSPGGIIVVDDCCPPTAPAYTWDGARQAYLEFTESHALQPRYVPFKLGVVQKPAH